MILEILNLIATSALAYGAIRIAVQANMLSKQSNELAEQSVSVEVDKHIFEWAQRCLNCASRISSLRMLPDGKMEDADFEEERRQHYAELFALKEEGTLFFEKDQKGASTPCIKALGDAAACVAYDAFTPPKAGDFEARRKANNELRNHIRTFSAAIQSRVSTQWSDN